MAIVSIPSPSNISIAHPNKFVKGLVYITRDICEIVLRTYVLIALDKNALDRLDR